MTVIDQHTFDELCQMSGEDFMPELIDTFLDDAPRMLAELQRSLDASEAEAFRRTAHSLKSNSKIFGAIALADLARELESMARENRLGEVGDLLQRLAAEYERVASALKDLRNG